MEIQFETKKGWFGKTNLTYPCSNYTFKKRSNKNTFDQLILMIYGKLLMQIALKLRV